MSTKDLTIEQFADLLNSESRRGIIDGSAIMKLIEKNMLPKVIYDIRGAIRLMVERGSNGLFVTEFPTVLATERAVDSIVGYPDMAKMGSSDISDIKYPEAFIIEQSLNSDYDLNQTI